MVNNWRTDLLRFYLKMTTPLWRHELCRIIIKRQKVHKKLVDSARFKPKRGDIIYQNSKHGCSTVAWASLRSLIFGKFMHPFNVIHLQTRIAPALLGLRRAVKISIYVLKLISLTLAAPIIIFLIMVTYCFTVTHRHAGPVMAHILLTTLWLAMQTP